MTALSAAFFGGAVGEDSFDVRRVEGRHGGHVEQQAVQQAGKPVRVLGHRVEERRQAAQKILLFAAAGVEVLVHELELVLRLDALQMRLLRLLRQPLEVGVRLGELPG